MNCRVPARSRKSPFGCRRGFYSCSAKSVNNCGSSAAIQTVGEAEAMRPVERDDESAEAVWRWIDVERRADRVVC